MQGCNAMFRGDGIIMWAGKEPMGWRASLIIMEILYKDWVPGNNLFYHKLSCASNSLKFAFSDPALSIYVTSSHPYVVVNIGTNATLDCSYKTAVESQFSLEWRFTPGPTENAQAEKVSFSCASFITPHHNISPTHNHMPNHRENRSTL